MTSRRVREHLGAAQPLELLLQYGHIDGGAVEAVLQHDELRGCNERRWRHAEKNKHFARSSMPTRRQLENSANASSLHCAMPKHPPAPWWRASLQRTECHRLLHAETREGH